MYARVVTVQAQAGKLDEITKLYRESIVPAAKQQKGFRGATLFTDRANDKGISVTRWETEADLQAGEASGGYYQEQIAKIAPMLSAPPVRETYEISVD